MLPSHVSECLVPFPVALRSHRLVADELYPVVNPAGSELPVVLRDEDGAGPAGAFADDPHAA